MAVGGAMLIGQMRQQTQSEVDKRLGELMLYIAAKCESLRSFGAVKLNKILFYSDFLAYERLGKPITGAVYQKLQHGPAPKRLLPVRQKLLKQQDAAMRVESLFVGCAEKRLFALRKPDLTEFSAEEIALVDEVIELCSNLTATEVSAVSHEFAGWKFAAPGEEIPYFTIHLPDEVEPLSKRELKRAKAVADRI